MTSQESDHTHGGFDLRAARREHDDGEQRSAHHHDDLPFSASNRAVGITLAIGIGLMVLVLMLPYLGSR
ncbi:hypothetical protein [Nesterenkonia sp.]|uniref:hypothetical protein n=1 Tax=Nesterenkonia sp. TaxID=704201 RepID=UPI00263505CF|nr:hypothetical protein [Nesterenkonia sp.]